MAMKLAFVRATNTLQFTESKIVQEKLQIMKKANDVAGTVRYVDNQRQTKGENDRLKGTEYLGLASLKHLSKKRSRNQSILKLTLATGQNWPYQRPLRDLWAREIKGKPRRY